MSKANFVSELQAMGLNPIEPAADKVQFEYLIPIGSNAGIKITVGSLVTNDYPMVPPGAPHFKSMGVTGWQEARSNIHQSPFGPEWKYWSRALPDWNNTERNAKVYMAFLRKILIELA